MNITMKKMMVIKSNRKQEQNKKKRSNRYKKMHQRRKKQRSLMSPMRGRKILLKGQMRHPKLLLQVGTLKGEKVIL